MKNEKKGHLYYFSPFGMNTILAPLHTLGEKNKNNKQANRQNVQALASTRNCALLIFVHLFVEERVDNCVYCVTMYRFCTLERVQK